MAKHSDILSETEIKAINNFLSGNVKLQAFLNAFPDCEKLSTSELLRYNDLFWSLPKVCQYIRCNQNKNISR